MPAAAIHELYKKICAAFSASDIDLVLSYFSDSEDMVKISNGQMLRGKAQLYDYWRERIGIGKAPLISIKNVVVHKIAKNHAWATADEHITLGDLELEAVVSNIFVFTNSGWKILLDHTTYLPPE